MAFIWLRVSSVLCSFKSFIVFFNLGLSLDMSVFSVWVLYVNSYELRFNSTSRTAWMKMVIKGSACGSLSIMMNLSRDTISGRMASCVNLKLVGSRITGSYFRFRFSVEMWNRKIENETTIVTFHASDAKNVLHYSPWTQKFPSVTNNLANDPHVPDKNTKWPIILAPL